MQKNVFLIFFLLFAFLSLSQRNVRDSAISTPWLSIHYGGNWTQGDLSDRYGYLNHIGFCAGYKLKSNWVFTTDASFIFGNQVKINGIFDHLIDSQGNITDMNGDIAMVYATPRGAYFNGSIGKIFPVFSPNDNSGLYLNFGAGYLFHYLNIETQDQVVPPLELDYKKGYDRFTSGLNLHQFIGYSFMANSGFYNFYGGIYIQEGFTKNKRTIFFDQPNEPVSIDLRLDIQLGFRLGWMIPVYKRQPKSFYFN